MPNDDDAKAERSGIDLPPSSAQPTTSQLIDALTHARAYASVHPLRPDDNVSFLQTYISLLFFVGPPGEHGRVYKVKKPVNLGFLDFTTLPARKHFCHEEVRLNRRLAPQIYLGVRAIIRDQNNHLRLGNESDGHVVDYAVEMIRLPPGRMLSALLQHSDVNPTTITAIADLLADFHSRCDTGPGIDEHASPQAIRQQIQETLDQLQPFTNIVLSQKLHTALTTRVDQFLHKHDALLRQRITNSRIRDGHGDVHCENICLLPNQIVIYDCIEFTPRFRCRDVACEIAFLAMDLDARSHPDLAHHLTQHYAIQTNDPQLHQLIPLYKIYLALVRAKVAALKSIDPHVDPSQRQTAQRSAAQYAHLAGAYLLQPALIIMCGLPASGKSWAARAIAKPFNATILRSDVIRKSLAGIDPHINAAQLRPEIYSKPFTQQTYATMFDQAHHALSASRSVVADATFATPALREPFIKLAQQLNIPWILAHTGAPDEIIRQRMQLRKDDAAEVSDANWDVYLQARSNFHAPDELPPHRVIHIGPNSTPEAVAAHAIDALLSRRHTNP